MEKHLKKFLEFNGKTIYFLGIDGTYWVAIKPICEALGINFDRQFKNINNSLLYRQLYAKQPMTGADGKTYKMASLPERYIYGWLFSIKSDNEELIAYQKKCCDILFNFFHGTITNRKELITEKAKRITQMEALEKELANVPEYVQIQQLKEGIKNLNSELTKQDKAMFTEQLFLFQ